VGLTFYAAHLIKVLPCHIKNQLDLLPRNPKAGQFDKACGAQGPSTGAVSGGSCHPGLRFGLIDDIATDVSLHWMALMFAECDSAVSMAKIASPQACGSEYGTTVDRPSKGAEKDMMRTYQKVMAFFPCLLQCRK